MLMYMILASIFSNNIGKRLKTDGARSSDRRVNLGENSEKLISRGLMYLLIQKELCARMKTRNTREYYLQESLTSLQIG